MGGHIVTGHVDTVGTLVDLGSRGEAREVTVGFPQEYSHLIAEKGSVTLDGVSLTVNAVGQDSFSVLLVPHTRKSTKFDQLAVGARVNIEVDILARYVARQLAAAVGKPVPRTTGEERWESLLSRHGYM
jgi:riboflavin synthase